MNINGNNSGTPQIEQVVTKGRLKRYVDWVNSTSGKSFVEIALINTKAQTFRITVNPEKNWK